MPRPREQRPLDGSGAPAADLPRAQFKPDAVAGRQRRGQRFCNVRQVME